MQVAFAVGTAGTEAPKPHTHTEAANVERHTSHLLMQESSQVSSVNLDSPDPSPMLMDHSVIFPIDQAPANAAVCAMICNVPYYKDVGISFMACLWAYSLRLHHVDPFHLP